MGTKIFLPGHSLKENGSPLWHPNIRTFFPPAACVCTLQETAVEQIMEEETSLQERKERASIKWVAELKE